MLYELHGMIILDEPTASLDRNSSEKIVEECFQQKEHAIVLLVSHDPSMRSAADHVINIKDGVVLDGESVL